MLIEHRHADVTEVRATPDGPLIRGYAAVFDRLSVNLGGFFEKVARGAFADSIRQRDVLLLRNHNPDFAMGRTSSGTLTLSEDRTGLAFEARLPNTAEARSISVGIERGDIAGMSFAFAVTSPDDETFEEQGRDIIRTLKRVTLFEVSTTPMPAYPDTSVAMDGARSIGGGSARDIRVRLKRKAMKRRLVSAMKRSLQDRERSMRRGRR